MVYSSFPGTTGAFSGPGHLAAILTDGAEPIDLYSLEGSRLYERFAEFDDSEQGELLRRLSRTEGDVLELACGGGRLTLPFLSLGRPVVGIDLSPEMIRILRDRYDRLPGSRRRVPLFAEIADMRDFDLQRCFGAIVLATTSVFLLDRDGRQRLFASVKRHLASGGVFLMTVHAAPLHPGATSTRVVPLSGTRPEVVLLSDLVGEDGRTREISALHVFRGDDGVLDIASYHSVVFAASEQELDAELATAGLTRVESVEAGALRILGYSA
jgi:SAM-dependent methyltransferase